MKKNALVTLLTRYRDRFAALQEAQFDKGEKQLKELLENSDDRSNFPVPTFVLAILIWSFVLLFPLLLLLDPSAPFEREVSMRNVVSYYVPLIGTMLIFLGNQRYLVPKCFFRKKYARFFLGNSILLLVSLLIREFSSFLLERLPGEGLKEFFSLYCFSASRGHIGVWTLISFLLITSLICVTCILIGVFTRQLIRAFVVREKTRATLQYELDFLKSQLSPHFLFNTLNNITSLISIDPKLAESSMTKLSQLLRMMLYQSSDEFISIKEDVDILKKYGELEKLRLSEDFDFRFESSLENPHLRIAPLLLMPLMENAMKHCVNPNGKSFAHISIRQTGDELYFRAENSNYPRKSKKGASGLGLVNCKKRLELLYSGKYTYNTEVVGDVYVSELKILQK